MSNRTVALYNCSQIVLYTICKMGWNSCLAIISLFTAFSGMYTAAFVATKIAAVLAAEALPDFQARNSVKEDLREDLEGFQKQAMAMFQKLKHYISVAFPESQWQSKWDAAGLGYYEAAGRENWNAIVAMLVSMTAFVTANSVVLQAALNMPASFITDLATVNTNFTTTHLAYMQAREDEEVATEIKVKANNAIYTDLITMFGVAKFLGLSATMMKQFTFASLVQYVTGAGTAGITGYIISAATGLPIENAEVTIASLGITVFSNSDGSYHLTNIQSGSYTVDVTAPNPSVGPAYIPQNVPVTVQIGTISTVNFAMLQ